MKEIARLCFERDAGRCRHCGATDNLDIHKLMNRDGVLGWHLSNLVTLCSACGDAKNTNLKNQCVNRIGVVLCGGRGTRLYPLTKFQNKHSLPIGLAPMLFYPLKTLREFGIYRVLVVIDRDGVSEAVSMLGSGKEFGMDISYKVQEGAGGISEALYLAKDFAKNSDEIFCILGDNIFDEGEFKDGFSWDDPKKAACVFLKRVTNPEDYGVAIIKNNEIVNIVEKPKKPVSNLGVVGLYVYRRKNVFNIIESIKPSDRGELEISSVNDYYASKRALQWKEVKGYWADCGGSIQRYAEASLHGAKQANVSIKEIKDFVSIVFDEK